nr:histidine--tRNA ligase [Candidatus Gracilibacteria bacterium]
MAKLLPGGFGELTPDKQKIQNVMKDIIVKNYESFGYVNIETPAVELNEVLTSKGGEEVGKQIFGLYGLKQGPSDLKPYSLHFDLTVPFARYVVDNESILKFPFKRYQIQKVWRGERQQRGRFKEFIQADIDLVGTKLPLNYDSEVILTLYRTLEEIFEFLKVGKGVEIHLNNKKFIEGICNMYEIFGDDKIKIFGLLDGFYKATPEEFLRKLEDLVGDKFLEINKIINTSIDELDESNKFIGEGVKELKQVYNSLRDRGVNVMFDPYITRGLDYYTGTVFETFISNYDNFGSICSGGRYDNLVESIRKVSNGGKTSRQQANYEGVGGSIGLSRLFGGLDETGMINKQLPLTQAIIFNTIGSNLGYRERVGEILRSNGISTDIYYSDDKLQKQFTYAESKNTIFGIFAGTDEQSKNEVIVRNLYSREQENVLVSNLVNYINIKLKETLK